MSTRIGIISDIHSAVKPLIQAIELFKQNNVSKIICAGDIAGYGEDELSEVIKLLKQNNCEIVLGNHDELSELEQESPVSDNDKQFLNTLPVAVSLEIENKKIYIVHAHPPDKRHGGIKLLDQQGDIIPSQYQNWCEQLEDLDADVLIVGHTHQVFSEKLGRVLVINPGSSLFNHSCMILTLPEMKTEIIALDDQSVIKSWNWGLFYQAEKNTTTNKKG